MNKLKTKYAAYLHACGLSHGDGAKLHNVTVSSVEKWSRGCVNPPAGVITEIAQYHSDMMAVVKGGQADLYDRSRLIAEAIRDLKVIASENQ